MTFEQRLAEVIRRALPKLAPEARDQLSALLRPGALAIVAGALGAWIVGHAFGYGEVIDVVIAVTGYASIGLAVFSGFDELLLFARLTWSSTTEAGLDAAATHLSRAIAILGVQTVLAVLFRRRPGGGRVAAGEPPPAGAGLRYEPTTSFDAAVPAGQGWTTFWGDVTVSTSGSAQDQAVVLLHERVHQFLAPKFYPLRRFRVENRIGSYFKSSLYRYVEEALAETIGQIGAQNMSALFLGLRFPVENGYVFLTRAGGFGPAMGGAGLLPEGAALIGSGLVGSLAFELYFHRDAGPRPAPSPAMSAPAPVP